MTKYYERPFAASGDKTPVPETDAGGFVNYDEGYTPDYQLAKTDPARKSIGRAPMNQIFNDVTDNIKQWQDNLFPEFSALKDGGYSRGHVVSLGGFLYQSGIDGNTLAPPSAGWGLYDLSFMSQKSESSIIDGRFDFWYEGTTQTTSGYGSDTMWLNEHSGSTTKTHSQLVLSNGEIADVPTAKYGSRTAVVSGGGSADSCSKSQRFEDVRKHAGKSVVISFYGKSDAPKNIAIEIIKNYGVGGSATDSAVHVETIALSTSFNKHEFTFVMPTNAGKTIGDDSYIQLRFWFDAGTGFNSMTNSLGNQSGTFDLACVSMNDGVIAGKFDELSNSNALLACGRYYEMNQYGRFAAVSVCSYFSEFRAVGFIQYAEKRTSPAITISAGDISLVFNETGNAITSIVATTSTVKNSKLFVITPVAMSLNSSCYLEVDSLPGTGISIDARL